MSIHMYIPRGGRPHNSNEMTNHFSTSSDFLFTPLYNPKVLGCLTMTKIYLWLSSKRACLTLIIAKSIKKTDVEEL